MLDSKLGQAITEKLEIPCIYDKSIQEESTHLRISHLPSTDHQSPSYTSGSHRSLQALYMDYPNL